MIKSMTGYGRGKSEGNGREYVVEIKAINHRYNDIVDNDGGFYEAK